jgi:hypothetical protein
VISEEIDPPRVDLEHLDRFVPDLLGDLHDWRVRFHRRGRIPRAQAVGGISGRVEADPLGVALDDLSPLPSWSVLPWWISSSTPSGASVRSVTSPYRLRRCGDALQRRRCWQS